MLEKTYQPSEIEARIHQEWMAADAFKAGRPERASAEPYCIVIPPPNVTGSLHWGHALNNTLQDVLCRFERMRGRDVLWQPGTDHAGIATQMVVERQLMERQQPDRRELGREKFIEKVWAWKAESGGVIINQLKRLGASCDWSRERFTMDEGLSRAVLKVFVELANTPGPDGRNLIYRDKRLVNWDPEFQTALSNLEVEMVDAKGSFSWTVGDPEKPFDPKALSKVLDRNPNGHLYHFRYPLTAKVPGYDKDYIVVATTRPETMLGDTAVAVHPEDARYKDLIGKKVVLPLVEAEIPIIADDYANPEKGSGAVKITPAHDFNDYQVYRRHPEIGIFNVLDERARIISGPFPASRELTYPVAGRPGMTQGHPAGISRIRSDQQIPEELRALDRFEARKRVVGMMEERGLLDKIEPTVHAVPHAQRGNAVIEPWLTDQWYVNAAELAKRAIAVVEEGKTQFVPKNWEKTYFDWMRNIEPWCISRQIWWGHQIPAWYGPDAEVFVAESEEKAIAKADKHYEAMGAQKFPSGVSGKEYSLRLKAGQEKLRRDEDVLDTWFSSALWPFSTLGWPDKTPELARYYPTSVLVTAFDIIFFWVARMLMMGMHFMERVPFHTVYIHAIVRDETGAKMSKSKGNVADPLQVIDEYGADAFRFTLAAMAAQGRDIRVSQQRIEGYRNFATKLWNAARFAEMNECVRQKGFDPRSVVHILNRWIAGEVERTVAGVTSALEAYKFNEAAAAVYEFTWGTFCDWYLELAKPILNGNDVAATAETRATAAWVLDQLLKLLHPFMPFITEELWDRLVEVGVKRENLLCLSPWPQVSGLANTEADEEIGWIIRLVSEVRSVRSEMNVPAGAKTPLVLIGASAATRARAEHHEDTLERLARLDGISFADAPPKGAAQIVIGETAAALPLAGIIDMGAERSRLGRELEKAKAEIGKIDAKLANASFLAKAPPEVVEENRERRAGFEATMLKLQAALRRVEAAV